jgi:hypothetical protein
MEDNIKIDLKYIGWEGEDCVHLAEHRDQWQDPANIVMNPQVS